jgi:hypothetical protein
MDPQRLCSEKVAYMPDGVDPFGLFVLASECFSALAARCPFGLIVVSCPAGAL